ncbi:unnamed protein product [Rotaria socialis]|uniref:Uncharacterized protein n=2 Tax=Rotaria socialis TaxID=392032 RepID=A0A821VNG1_9BILA|nr:unnamed protein product [Rotaria socialis]
MKTTVCAAISWSKSVQNDSDELIVVFIVSYFYIRDLDRLVNISLMSILRTVYVWCIGYFDPTIELFDFDFVDSKVCGTVYWSTTVQDDSDELIVVFIVSNFSTSGLDRSVYAAVRWSTTVQNDSEELIVIVIISHFSVI